MRNKQEKKKSTFINFIKLVFSRLKKKEVKHQMYVFLVCFIISIVLWLAIKLSYTYTTTIEYPVKFINISEDMGLVNKLPKTLSLRVTDKGSKLLENKLNNISNEIVIDVSTLGVKKTHHGYQSIFLSTNNLKDISYQTGFYNNLVDIKPDSIVLKYEKYVSKKFNVTPLIDFKIPQEFWLAKPVEISPKKVTVSAFHSDIDSIQAIFTEKVNLGELKGDIKKKIALKLPKNINGLIEPDSIQFSVSSKRFTEKEIEVPIEVKNFTRHKVKCFPSKVKVNFLVSFDDYSKIETDMFSAIIEVYDDEKKSYPVRIAEYPNFIELKTITPNEVEIMIIE